MAGDLYMDGHQISYLKAPEHDHMAATTKYADTKLSILGGTMQGGIGMSGNRFPIYVNLCWTMMRSTFVLQMNSI